MTKLLKYELKSSKNFMLILIAVLGVATASLQFSITGDNKKFDDFLMMFAFMVFFGAALTFLIYMISLLRKDLYSDTGYLTFSLPLNGFQIIAAKILNVILWTIIVTLAVTIINFIVAYINIPEFRNNIPQLISLFKTEWKRILQFLTSGLTVLVKDYIKLMLSIILCKAIFKNNKMSWFFIIIYFIIGFIEIKINSYTINTVSSLTEIIFGTDMGIIFNPKINSVLIETISFNLVFSLVMIILASILIEKYVEI